MTTLGLGTGEVLFLLLAGIGYHYPREASLCASAVNNPPAMPEMWETQVRIPGLGRSLRRIWQPSPLVILLGELHGHGQRSLVGVSLARVGHN